MQSELEIQQQAAASVKTQELLNVVLKAMDELIKYENLHHLSYNARTVTGIFEKSRQFRNKTVMNYMLMGYKSPELEAMFDITSKEIEAIRNQHLIQKHLCPNCVEHVSSNQALTLTIKEK